MTGLCCSRFEAVGEVLLEVSPRVSGRQPRLALLSWSAAALGFGRTGQPESEMACVATASASASRPECRGVGVRLIGLVDNGCDCSALDRPRSKQ